MTELMQRDIGGEVDFLKDDVKRLDKSFIILTVVVFVHLIVTSVLILGILNMQ